MKQTAYLVIMAVLFLGCKNEKKPLAGSAVENPDKPKITVEDPFSGTNLVDKIKLVDLEGNPVDLKSFAGKKIFLNFWATRHSKMILYS